jgi:hypothetical protein
LAFSLQQTTRIDWLFDHPVDGHKQAARHVEKPVMIRSLNFRAEPQFDQSA